MINQKRYLYFPAGYKGQTDVATGGSKWQGARKDNQKPSLMIQGSEHYEQLWATLYNGSISTLI